ncbi:hypothetical protein [Kitasatospora sp. NPDC094016]|uniref:hypothetical protein n=1 Tax=Kitasatospora sp. NPDC094016 TaxID=3154986 RepID=UPI00333463AD
MAEIDPEFIGDPDGFVPPEAIRGFWRVGTDGRLTGEYEVNPGFGPPKDDFGKLTETDHWLGWLGDDPVQAIRDEIAKILEQQAAGAQLEWIKVLEHPGFLIGGRPEPDNQHMIVTRRARDPVRAVGGCPLVPARGSIGSLHLGRGRAEPDARRDRVWFDLQATQAWAEEQLQDRIYLK